MPAIPPPDALLADLIRDEGLVLKPYRDTVGKLTVGVGRNLDDVGLSEDEARYLLANDVARVEEQCHTEFPWFAGLTPNRKRALLNMAFNMGLSRLKGFHDMLWAFGQGDYSRAADEALASRWARQVHERSVRIATLIREG